MLFRSGHGHRLLVSNHRQGFERRQRKPDGRLQAFREGADYLMLLRLGRHAISARYLADLNAVVGCAVFSDKFFQTRAHTGLHLRLVRCLFTCSFRDDRRLYELDHLLESDWRLRRIDDGFELSFEGHRNQLSVTGYQLPPAWSALTDRWRLPTANGSSSPVVAHRRLLIHNFIEVRMFADGNLSEHFFLTHLDRLQAHHFQQREKHAHQGVP